MNSPWTKEEKKIFEKLTSPFKIQEFLDSIPYSADPIYRSPRSVLRDRLYDFIASHRYQWFGKTDACSLPDEGVRRRMIE